MIFLFLLGCSEPLPADAAPFAGVLVPLDRDADGVVKVAEYPLRAPSGATAEKVDKDADGVIGAEEVRDEVFAVDPASFDRMAWSHTSSKPTKLAPESRRSPGVLAETLRFLADLQAARAPTTVPPTEAEIDAAARAGMATPEGAAVLARFAAAGIPVPAALATAPADPPPLPAAMGAKVTVGEEHRLYSDGPGGPTALRTPRNLPRRTGAPGAPPPGAGPGGPPAPPEGAPPPPDGELAVP